MARRLVIVLILTSALLGAGAAWGYGEEERKRAVDEQISRVRDRIAAVDAREGVLTSEISRITAKIRARQRDVDVASSRLDRLEHELALYERRLSALTELQELQTRRFELLRGQYALADQRLNERIVAIYEADDPGALEVVLSSSSFTDVLDQLDYLGEIGEQDLRIAAQVEEAKRDVRAARERTRRTKASVARAKRVIAARTREQRVQHERLLASRRALDAARAGKERTLDSVQQTEREYLHEVAGLEQASAGLAARIRSAQEAAEAARRAQSAAAAAAAAAPSATAAAAAPEAATSGGGSSRPAEELPEEEPASSYSTYATASTSGFVWPVSGPVTSTFGWRWGRMHEGVDIAASSGTPIQAAAGGTVIYASWMGGFGNLVVVDHGGGLATAYAHMSSIGSSVGQAVGQGQTIGYVGCTGHCFGDHLHFEVRSGGSAVDPLAYL